MALQMTITASPTCCGMAEAGFFVENDKVKLKQLTEKEGLTPSSSYGFIDYSELYNEIVRRRNAGYHIFTYVTHITTIHNTHEIENLKKVGWKVLHQFQGAHGYDLILLGRNLKNNKGNMKEHDE